MKKKDKEFKKLFMDWYNVYFCDYGLEDWVIKDLQDKVQAWNTRTPSLTVDEIEKMIVGFKPKIIMYHNKKGGISEIIDIWWKEDLAQAIFNALTKGGDKVSLSLDNDEIERKGEGYG